MKLTIDQAEEVETPFAEEFLRDIAERTLGKIAFLADTTKHLQLGVAAVSEERIQELNHEYRGKDKTTDILSFGSEENWIESQTLPEGEEFNIGDLIYSPAFILRAAMEDEITAEHEMAYIFSHGVLHLLGYDHSDEMFALQDEVTKEYIQNQKQ